MAAIPKKIEFKEIRTSGKEVDVVYLYTTHLDRILSIGSRDLYNDIMSFNSYEGAVENLVSTLTFSGDKRFKIDLEGLNEIFVESIEDKVHKLRDKLSICLSYMSRKGYWTGGDYEGGVDVLIKHIQDRVKRKLDALIGVDGERGSGKSYTTLELCGKCDPTFTLDRVFFNGEAFRMMLEKEHYPPGTAFMWDEATAGKGLNKRRSISNDNLEFNNILQVIRKRRYIVFFTMPNIEMVDKASLDFFGGRIEPKDIDREKNLCYVKFKEKAGTGDAIYWKFLRTPSNFRITSIPVGKPKKKLVDDYEILKDKFLAGIIKLEGKKEVKKEVIDVHKVFTEMPPIESLLGDRGGVNIAKIQNAFSKLHPEKELGRRKAEQIKQMLIENEKESKEKKKEKEDSDPFDL